MDADAWNRADLREMLTLAAGRVSDRKLDLFNLWCCHTLAPYLRDRRSVVAVRYAERHVDEGWPDTPERAAVRSSAKQAVEELAQWAHRCPRTPAEYRARRVYAQAALVAQQTVANDLPSRGVLSNSDYTAYAYSWANDDCGAASPDDSPTIQALRETHLRLQELIFRDIVGDPFRSVAAPASMLPRWRTADVVGLARAAYEDGAFVRLPMLADALMDAGCDDDAILAHCRGSGPHARGCWVVDLVLAKG
jgi:hypothetical protein